MTDEQDRLTDLNIEEALGRTTPPDLSARIMQAADRPLDEAITPISGAHAVPRTVRPKGRRLTAAIPKRNWQGAGAVAAFMLLLAIGLVAFMVWKSPSLNQPASTAGQPQPANQSPVRQHRDVPANAEQSPEPQPEPATNTQSPPRERRVNAGDDGASTEPQPEPDNPVEQPKPDPKPDDTVEQPQPEPKPDDTIEQPQPEPKPDDGSVATPTHKLAVVASFTAVGLSTFGYPYQVRDHITSKWEMVGKGSHGLEYDKDLDLFWVYEGTHVKVSAGEIALTNGAQLYVTGQVAMFPVEDGFRVQLIDDDLYVDSQGASSFVTVTHGYAKIVASNSAALFESTKSKVDIFCVEGSLTVDGTEIPEGFLATNTTLGLSKLKEARRGDWNNPKLGAVPSRHLGIEDFATAPAGKMISGQLVTRSAAQLCTDKDGHVAIDTGRNAAVGFGLDGGHSTLRNETVRVRYRATGAEKMVLQMFCPARNDNFGIDLTPGKAGEWHILEIRLSDLRDRETHKDAPAPGSGLSSFTLALDGKSDAQLEIDWVEFVREARFGE